MKFYLFGSNGATRPGSFETADEARTHLRATGIPCAVISERDLHRILSGTVRLPEGMPGTQEQAR